MAGSSSPCSSPVLCSEASPPTSPIQEQLSPASSQLSSRSPPTSPFNKRLWRSARTDTDMFSRNTKKLRQIEQEEQTDSESGDEENLNVIIDPRNRGEVNDILADQFINLDEQGDNVLDLPSSPLHQEDNVCIDEDSSDSGSPGSDSLSSVHSHHLSGSDNSPQTSDSENESSDSRPSSDSDEDSEGSHPSEDDEMLFNGCPVSTEKAVLDLVSLFVSEKWKKKSLRSTLQYVRSLLPQPNEMPGSLHLLFKYLRGFGTPIEEIKHYYCSACLIPVDKEIELSCKDCNGQEFNVFYEFPVAAQIKHMLESRNLADAIDTFRRTYQNDGNVISDIRSSSEYRKVFGDLNGPYDIVLLWNVDGISASKSSKVKLWVLLAIICGVSPAARSSFMLVIGVWCDKVEPPGNLFVSPFVDSLQKLNDIGGLEWTHPRTQQQFKCRIVAPVLSADAPAKAKVLIMKEFSYRFGCMVCEQKTIKLHLTPIEIAKKVKSRKRRFVYQEDADLLRTEDQMVRQSALADECKQPVKGVLGKAKVSDLPFFKRSSGGAADYMHTVLLGVVKYFTKLWFEVQGTWFIGRSVAAVNACINSLKVFDFVNRLLPDASSLSYWKASDFRFWLLFVSLVAVSQVLPERYVQHWMLLVNAIYILLQTNITEEELTIAEIQLRMFVRDVGVLYGMRFYTYNVHNLLHLGLLVRRWGNLWATSTFIFENFNGVLLNLIHGTKHKGQELINNLKISQGVEVLRHIVNDAAQPGHPSEKEEDVLDKPTVRLPNTEINGILSALNIVQGVFHKRARHKSQIFTSKCYDVNKKRHNSHVRFTLDNTSADYGQIECFIKTDSRILCVIRRYQIQNERIFFDNATMMQIKHLLPVANTNDFVTVPLSCVLEKMIKVHTYLCLRPNPFEVNL